MDPDLKLHINETGKYKTEYLTCAIKNLSKLDSYKDLVFNNINKNIMLRVEKLQNLKSRINRIKGCLSKLNECNDAMTIKSKRFYPTSEHKFYKYLNLVDQPEEITNLINTNYNCSNPNIPIINIKKPLVERPEKNVLGKIPRESMDDCLNAQLLSNMQKKVKDLASELYEIKFKNIGTSLVNELNDLVYENTPYLETSFDFVNKKLIQKADLLWKFNKEEFDLRQQVNIQQIQNEEDEVPKAARKSSVKLASKLQEAPKSITSKAKIEKDVTKKVLLEKPREKQEFNLPTSINNLDGVAELVDETPNEEIPVDENIYPEREEIDLDFENPLENPNFEDDYDLPIDIITRINLENLKNEENTINSSTPNYNYQTANTSNINTSANNINININTNMNKNPPIASSITSGNIVVISGGGPGIPPPPQPPPPPPPPPVVPVVNKAVKAAKSEGEEGNQIGEEPKKEISREEELKNVKLKKVGTVKSGEIKKKPQSVSHQDLLRQQIMLRFQRLKLHEEKNEDEEEENEDE